MAFATETYVVKGMRQDDSDLLFNSNKESLPFAFENYNMRFTTDTKTTSLVATQEKGNNQMSLYATETFFVDNTVNIEFVPLTFLPFKTVGYCVLDKYLVIFGKCIEDATFATNNVTINFTAGQDIIIRFERQYDALYGWVVYKGNELNFNTAWPLETVGNVETNLVKKVYFVDGINVPRAVNIVSQDAGQLSNINLGFALSLNDELTVSKDYSLVGNYPMGKIRFFYTYYNDLQSESNIVDWSPFFDCNYINQGGSEDSTYKTKFAFKVTVNNVDHQFGFIRIYFQHFTQNDSLTYTLKYIERPLSLYDDTFSTIITFDGEDVKDYTGSYLDMKVINYTFVPYTLAEKNNRMFYGNIKRSLPSVQNIDFKDTANIVFYDKYIGYEDLQRNVVYQYTSNDTTFKGSNFDYMGFRKYNWYRFGIIAQYYTGEWSDVLFIKDAQCDRTSRTEIEYDGVATTFEPVSGPAPISTHSFDKPTRKPIKSKYYIPSARLTPTSAFFNALQQLYALGFKRIKPVCVVPTYDRRDVLTQGISCSTIYIGGKRTQLNTDNGLFAMPSYFFRPLPLYPIADTLNDINNTYKPKYPYTLRKVSDLLDTRNTKLNGNWLLNPTFDNEAYINYNPIFREYRHGYSLPPKDRINAELQSSDMSLHDYYYLEIGQLSGLFGGNNGDGVNLFDFITNTNDHNSSYLKKVGVITDADWADSRWYDKVVDAYGVVPCHDLYTTGYNHTVFIDESFCTLNSPEVDYNFAQQIEPWYKDQNIEVVGYAQVTNSLTDIDVPDTQFIQDPELNTNIIDRDSSYPETLIGKCLFNIASNDLGIETYNYIKSLRIKGKLQNNPLAVFSGPWWFDTMLVNSFKHMISQNLQTTAEMAVAWAGLVLNPISSLFQWLISLLSDWEFVLFGHRKFSPGNALDPDATQWFLDDDDLYNLNTTALTLDPTKNCHLFARGMDFRFSDKAYKWTTSFYGETAKLISKKNERVLNHDNSPYPYTETHKRPVLFIDFPLNTNFGVNGTHDNDVHDTTTDLFQWAKASLTWNTVKLTPNWSNDVYWSDFFKNRQKPDAHSPIAAGSAVLPAVNGIPRDGVLLGDAVQSIYNGDFRNTFTYYFFPYFALGKPVSYYERNGMPTDVTNHVHVVHPWLLPRGENYATRRKTNSDWKAECNSLQLQNLLNYTECEDYLPLQQYYNKGSEYGCHYYAPFSTNFAGAMFDPYYAHVIYPFMSNGMPFCGSTDAYTQGHDATTSVPASNSTHSFLYSNCTNYVDESIDNNVSTYSAYYHAPNLTQELRAEPDLTSIPFVSAMHGSITHLYSYNCGDTAEANQVILKHRTQTLTAATKWYRGFRALNNYEDGSNLITTGGYLNKPNIAGNLLFSGYLPQFCTKSGLYCMNVSSDSNHVDHINFKKVMSAKTDEKEKITAFFNPTLQNIELNYQSTPHIVYHNEVDGKLMLLDKFYVQDQHMNILDTNYDFLPQFYYKEFINEPVPYYDDQPNLPYQVTGATYWYYNTYPHTGHFEEYMFNALTRATQPYWNYSGIFNEYPTQISEQQIHVDLDDSKFITHDSNGYVRQKENYWVLPISNMYNTDRINAYSSVDDADKRNPYLYDNISPEQWNWKMCGNTLNISTFLDPSQPSRPTVHYLEGDTYFQRYNCFKTVSKDTAFSQLWENQSSEVAPINSNNDVTETASVMIESYYNLDGIFWDHNSITTDTTSPMIHPYYNNQHQINAVYSIQNDICDVFKQVDTNYQSSYLDHYPTQIMWSAQKQDGEDIDSWGIVPITNKMLVSGEMGAINKLISYSDNVYCLQEHGLSVLNYNAHVIEPSDTDSTLSVYLSDATKLQDVTYLSRTTGTLNKWSVVIGQRGFYWIDESLHQFCNYGPLDNRFGIIDLSTKYGFKSWSNAHISSDNCLWNIDTFSNTNVAFKGNCDLKNGDIYWSNGEYCICFNEQLDCFTSFYSYETTPYKFNYLDQVYSIIENADLLGTNSIWNDQVEYTHKIYNTPIDSYIELLVNPAGQYDKIFNFIEYNTIVRDINDNLTYNIFNPYNAVSVENEYQMGHLDMNKSNTQTKFQLWRTTLPRETKNGKLTMNRIRSPWCKIKLIHDHTWNHLLPGEELEEYIDKLYYINVNYTLPEQPIKSNIRI